MSGVRTDDRGAVRHVVLSRPEKRNALDGDLIAALGEAFAEAARDPEVRCLVVRGDGPAFSAGVDVAALGALAEDPDRLAELRRPLLQAWNLLESMDTPTIAQVHGVCLGAALELALACDLRTVAADARLGMPEVRIGLIPDVGGSSRLPAVVGLGRAKELVLTARTIDGAEAERIGLATRVAAADELDAATAALAGELMAGGPLAVGAAKHVLDAAARPSLPATLEQELELQDRLVRSADFAEGVRALAERRPPRFGGR